MKEPKESGSEVEKVLCNSNSGVNLATQCRYAWLCSTAAASSLMIRFSEKASTTAVAKLGLILLAF